MYREFLFGIIRFDNGRIVCPECGRVMEDGDDVVMYHDRWLCPACVQAMTARYGYRLELKRNNGHAAAMVLSEDGRSGFSVPCYDALLLREVCDR